MLNLDEAALETHFWSIELSYTGDNGQTVLLSDDQKLVVNQPSQQLDDTQPWVRFSIVPGDSQMDATGTQPVYHQLGTAFLNIYAPLGTGLGAAKQMRDQFASAFRNWTSPDGHCSEYKTGFNYFEADTYSQIKVTIFWESLRRAN